MPVKEMANVGDHRLVPEVATYCNGVPFVKDCLPKFGACWDRRHLNGVEDHDE